MILFCEFKKYLIYIVKIILLSILNCSNLHADLAGANVVVRPQNLLIKDVVDAISFPIKINNNIDWVWSKDWLIGSNNSRPIVIDLNVNNGSLNNYDEVLFYFKSSTLAPTCLPTFEVANPPSFFENKKIANNANTTIALDVIDHNTRKVVVPITKIIPRDNKYLVQRFLGFNSDHIWRYVQDNSNAIFQLRPELALSKATNGELEIAKSLSVASSSNIDRINLKIKFGNSRSTILEYPIPKISRLKGESVNIDLTNQLIENFPDVLNVSNNTDIYLEEIFIFFSGDAQSISTTDPLKKLELIYGNSATLYSSLPSSISQLAEGWNVLSAPIKVQNFSHKPSFSNINLILKFPKSGNKDDVSVCHILPGSLKLVAHEDVNKPLFISVINDWVKSIGGPFAHQPIDYKHVEYPVIVNRTFFSKLGGNVSKNDVVSEGSVTKENFDFKRRFDGVELFIKGKDLNFPHELLGLRVLSSSYEYLTLKWEIKNNQKVLPGTHFALISPDKLSDMYDLFLLVHFEHGPPSTYILPSANTSISLDSDQRNIKYLELKVKARGKQSINIRLDEAVLFTPKIISISEAFNENSIPQKVTWAPAPELGVLPSDATIFSMGPGFINFSPNNKGILFNTPFEPNIDSFSALELGYRSDVNSNRIDCDLKITFFYESGVLEKRVCMSGASGSQYIYPISLNSGLKALGKLRSVQWQIDFIKSKEGAKNSYLNARLMGLTWKFFGISQSTPKNSRDSLLVEDAAGRVYPLSEDSKKQPYKSFMEMSLANIPWTGKAAHNDNSIDSLGTNKFFRISSFMLLDDSWPDLYEQSQAKGLSGILSILIICVVFCLFFTLGVRYLFAKSEWLSKISIPIEAFNLELTLLVVRLLRKFKEYIYMFLIALWKWRAICDISSSMALGVLLLWLGLNNHNFSILFVLALSFLLVIFGCYTRIRVHWQFSLNDHLEIFKPKKLFTFALCIAILINAGNSLGLSLDLIWRLLPLIIFFQANWLEILAAYFYLNSKNRNLFTLLIWIGILCLLYLIAFNTQTLNRSNFFLEAGNFAFLICLKSLLSLLKPFLTKHFPSLLESIYKSNASSFLSSALCSLLLALPFAALNLLFIAEQLTIVTYFGLVTYVIIELINFGVKKISSK